MPLASRGWVWCGSYQLLPKKKTIGDYGLAFLDRDERVTQSTRLWKLHKVTHKIINDISKENVKVYKIVSKFE